MLWRFLLGDVPPRLLGRATAELAQHDDLQLLGVADEMDYRHVGDAYSALPSSFEVHSRASPRPCNSEPGAGEAHR